MPIRILLADDHVMLRQGLHTLLEQAGMAVIGEGSDGQEALRVAHEQHPDVEVLGYRHAVLEWHRDRQTAARGHAAEQDRVAHHAHRRPLPLRGPAGGGHRPGHPRRPAGGGSM